MRLFCFFTLSLLISFLNNVRCQTNSDTNHKFSIKGEITGRDTGMIVLWYHDQTNKVHHDTVQLQNGKFDFAGTTNHVSETYLWTDPNKLEFDNPSMIRFLLEPNNISIIGRKDEEAKAIINGSASEIEKENWDKEKFSLTAAKFQLHEAIDSLFQGIKEAGNESHRDRIKQLSKKIDSVNEKIKAMDIGYLKKHPDSYLSAYLLSKHVRKLSVDSIQFYYTGLSNKVKESSVAHDVLIYVYPKTDDSQFRKANPLVDKKFDERLRSIKSVHDLSLKDTSGATVYFSSFKGKYLILDFWGRSCQPCIENIPVWNRLIKEYDPGQVQFISISVDAKVSIWKQAIREHSYKGLHVSDLQGFKSLAAVYCKVLWVPTYVIADRNGMIINYNAPQPRDPELKKLLDKLLNEKISEAKNN